MPRNDGINGNSSRDQPTGSSRSRPSSVGGDSNRETICTLTRAIVEDWNETLPGINAVEREPSHEDVVRCIEQCAQRLIVESDARDPVGADAAEMWKMVLQGDALCRAPVSFGKFLLKFAWGELIDLRVVNHRDGRCTHVGVFIDGDTPACTSPPEHDSSRRLVEEPAEHDEDPMEPDYMSAQEVQEVTRSVSSAEPQSDTPRKPVQQDVTAKDILDCLIPAMQRTIVEHNRLPDAELVEIYQAVLNEQRETTEQQTPGVLICMLAYVWGDLAAQLELNREAGLPPTT